VSDLIPNPKEKIDPAMKVTLHTEQASSFSTLSFSQPGFIGSFHFYLVPGANQKAF